jgi:tripartite-type tricarboxylate transporter receptor subunit TctC
MNLLRLAATALAALACISTVRAPAENYPAKPVRIVVPYSPGGSTDILARAIGQKLGEAWRQSVVVENRVGASGMIGAEFVARSSGDGYTLLMASPAEIAVNQHVYSKMSYSPERDFAPITLVAIMPHVIVASPVVPANNIRELIALAKAKPGALSFVSPGTGSTQHLTGELFNALAGTSIVHVPYKGAGQSIPDVIAGQVPLGVFGLLSIMPYAKAGRLRVLAVTTAKRSPAAPEFPTLAESGFPEFDTSLWFGLLAPAAVRKEIITTIHAATVATLRGPEVSERINSQGGEAIGNSPAEFAAFIAAESAKYARIAKQAGVKLD